MKKQVFSRIQKRTEKHFSVGTLLVVPFQGRRLLFIAPVNGILADTVLHISSEGTLEGIRLTASLTIENEDGSTEVQNRAWDIKNAGAFQIGGELPLVKGQLLSFNVETTSGEPNVVLSSIFHSKITDKATKREIV